MLGNSIVDTTDFAYLSEKEAKQEARQVLKWIKKESNEPTHKTG